MTVSTTTIRTLTAGDDSTVDFPFSFPCVSEDDLYVILQNSSGTETVQTVNVDFTVAFTGGDPAAGGILTMGTAPAIGEYLLILRILDLTQESDYIENDELRAAAIEGDFDETLMKIQQLNEAFGRCLHTMKSSAINGSSLEIPEQGSMVFGWNASATAIELYSTTSTQFNAGAFGVPVDKTISTGSITIDETERHILLTGEGDTTDTLTGITQTGYTRGDEIILRGKIGISYQITIQNNSTLIIGSNFIINSEYDCLRLVYVGSNKWMQSGRNSNA